VAAIRALTGVGTSLRHGCRSLVQVEILPRPPLDRASDNPWPNGRRIYRLDYGQEEAAAKFGADPRVYLTTVKKFTGGDEGWVKKSSPSRSSGSATTKASSCPRKCPAPKKYAPPSLSCSLWLSWPRTAAAR